MPSILLHRKNTFTIINKVDTKQLKRTKYQNSERLALPLKTAYFLKHIFTDSPKVIIIMYNLIKDIFNTARIVKNQT